MEILIRLSVYFNCLNLVPVGEQSEEGNSSTRCNCCDSLSKMISPEANCFGGFFLKFLRLTKIVLYSTI